MRSPSHRDSSRRRANAAATGIFPVRTLAEATRYIHPVSWSLLLDTEYGYGVVSLNNRRHVVMTFNVNEDDPNPLEDDPGDDTA